MDFSQTAVIIPTCNAKRDWQGLSAGLRQQGIPAENILLIDSDSSDGTRELAQAEGYRVVRIERRDFNHGGTRQLALQSVPWATVVIYLTQDAVLASPDALSNMLEVFEDPAIAAAYGRQLPRKGAGPIEAHARLFNYPAGSHVRDFESRHKLGIKAAFLSNSFSAYRVLQLCEVGGFPADVIMAEDALVAGKLLMAGWKVAYVAEAQAFHSHPFTIAEEFRRYFDTGVYHRRQAWLREQFGNPSGEGKRFVLSELKYLGRSCPHLIFPALLRTVSKAAGYFLGLREQMLGASWRRRLSYHKGFWSEEKL